MITWQWNFKVGSMQTSQFEGKNIYTAIYPTHIYFKVGSMQTNQFEGKIIFTAIYPTHIYNIKT